MTTAFETKKVAPATREANSGGLERVQSLSMDYVEGIDYSACTEAEIRSEVFEEGSVLGLHLEAHWFTQMNLAMFSASQLRDSLDPGYPDLGAVAEIERLVQRGQRLRNGLATVYTKLAYSIARGFVTAKFPFDELASEAQATLLYAISKFNPERGFRFSTYATHALRRRLYRHIGRESTSGQVNVDWQSIELAESGRWSFDYQRRVENSIRQIDELLLSLSARERYVVRSRFGWGRDFDARTLQAIADELGVSRERVRQLEARALVKLRKRATETGSVWGQL